MRAEKLIDNVLRGKSVSESLNESDDQDPHEPKVGQIWVSSRDKDYPVVLITDVNATSVTYKAADQSGRVLRSTPAESGYDTFITKWRKSKKK